MEKHAGTPEPRKNTVLLLFFQSLIAAALIPIVLGRSSGGGGGGGDKVIVVVWRLSLLLFSYFYSAVCVLSTTTSTTRKARLFVQLTYPALLAFVVDAVLSHAAGCVIIYLDSVWIACIFGHAIAERIASAMPTAAAAAATKNPVHGQKAEEKLEVELATITFVAIISSICMIIPAACVMDDPDYTLVFVVVLTAILCISLPVAIICALKPLRLGGVVVLGEECGTGNVLACWYLSAFLLLTWSFIFLSEVGAMVALWICVLGLAVFLGYCLRLHCYYVHIMKSTHEMVAPPADDVDKNQTAGGDKEQTENKVNSTNC